MGAGGRVPGPQPSRTPPPRLSLPSPRGLVPGEPDLPAGTGSEERSRGALASRTPCVAGLGSGQEPESPAAGKG